MRRVWRHRHSRNNKEAVLFLTRLIMTTWAELFSIQQPTRCRDDVGRDVKGSPSCVWITSDGVIRHRSRVHVWTWDCPLDVPSSATIWIYIKSNRDAPYFRYHQSVDCRPVSQAVRGGGPFVAVLIHIGVRVDRWQADSIFFHRTLHFPLSVTISSMLHINSSIMGGAEGL